MYDFLFARSYGDENALARLQSNPLINGLVELGFRTFYWELSPNMTIDGIPEHKYFIYHHDDMLAIQLLIEIKKIYKTVSVCLTSDIYNISIYVSLAGLTDLFIAPTEMHKVILQSAVTKPVIFIPECIDPIAYPPPNWIKCDMPEIKKILWFGYPESFEKSFKYLMPALNASSITTADMVVITRGQNVIQNVEHRDFDANSFYEKSTDVQYALLSHFSYDNQLNTWIKSPNKLVTSIIRGFVPFCSATPAYSELLNRYNLAELLFKTPDQLGELLVQRENITANYSRLLLAAAEDLEQHLDHGKIATWFINGI